MRIHHFALYTNDLEKIKHFYETYFNASANSGYHNVITGLKTYFLSFEDDTRLEIMTRPQMESQNNAPVHLGYIHLAMSVGNSEAVDDLTARLEKDGYTILSRPRTTGDGYYESCILDPEGNQIELCASENE
ncbi:MAG: glyoxalase [Herbinix sp.]|jgi:lactoylglutathione lyase|nr:glyoxalase [Herbinix sp.]